MMHVRYVTKADRDIIQCEDHQDLLNSTECQAATSANAEWKKSKEFTNNSFKRKRTLDAGEVSEIILRNNIRTRTKLHHYSKFQSRGENRFILVYSVQSWQN